MFCLVLLCAVLASEHPAVTFNQMRQDSRQSFREGNLTEFLSTTQKLHQLQPGHVPTLYNLAMVHALLGNHQGSVAALDQIGDMGLIVSLPENEGNLATRNSPEYVQYLKRSVALSKPMGHAELAFSLVEPDFFPEGIVYDSRSKAWFIGSVHQCKIIRRSETGNLTTFVEEGRDGLHSVLGMTVDQQRRLLWATSSGLPQSRNIDNANLDTAALFCFNLDTGVTIARYPLMGSGHNLGDVTLNKAGDVFATDNKDGHIYRLVNSQLVSFVTSPWLVSPQGLTFSADEKLLYVASYTYGLLVVDMDTHEVHQLKSSSPYAITGTDGLLRYGNRLIGIQNAYKPHRVISWQLSEDGRKITDSKILLSQQPSFDEPTLGALVGNTYYLVANSQWGKYDKANKPLAQDKLKAPQILRLKLD